MPFFTCKLIYNFLKVLLTIKKKSQFHFSNATCMQLPSSFRPKELRVSHSETLDCVTTEWESALKAKKRDRLEL